LNYWNQGFDDKDNKSSDSFFVNRLQMDFGFHATDEVSVYWRLRAPGNQRWGAAAANGGNNAAMTRWIYGEVKQDWGTVAVGKLNDARADLGLASLGWTPGGPDVNATNFLPFDYDTPVDGVHYANRWDNGFQLAAAFLRIVSVPNNRDGDDQTKDLFAVEPAFFWDGGGASLGLHYIRDNASDYVAGLGPKNGALKMFRINPAISHSFGDFSVHFEGMAAWGSQEKYITGTGMKDFDSEGYAFYMDVDYNYGPGNVNLAGWWAAGASNPDGGGDDKIKGMVGFDTFAPLVVAYYPNGYDWNRGSYNQSNAAIDAVTVANMLSGPSANRAGQSGGLIGEATANHWGIDLNGAHAFTDDLTLTYALAYLSLNKTREGAKKAIGFEADLGLQIQLLDNLQFGTTFGYLFAGDALRIEDTTPGTFKDAEDAYTWINTLTFAF
jgi:hypothetical protein